MQGFTPSFDDAGKRIRVFDPQRVLGFLRAEKIVERAFRMSVPLLDKVFDLIGRGFAP